MFSKNKHSAAARLLIKAGVLALAAGTMVLSQGCDSLLWGTDIGVDSDGNATIGVNAGTNYGTWYPYTSSWNWPYPSGWNWPYNSGWGPAYYPGPMIPPRPRPRPKPVVPNPPVNPPIFRPGNNGFRPGATIVPGKNGPIAIPNRPININGSNPGPAILPGNYRPGANSR